MSRKGFSDGSDGKESACNARDVGEDPLEEEMANHSSAPAWEISWTEDPGGATVQGVAKSQTRLSG